MSAREPYVAVRGENSKKASGMPSRRRFPQPGDVLASRPTARADIYEISVVPTNADLVAVRYDDAMEQVRELARSLSVDGWYTCDHTHFARIASHRTVTSRSPDCGAGRRN
jgi:hypothetical protein